MRLRWLKIVRENSGASRSELKKKGKGVHTWIFTHDRLWYEEVSPAKRVKRGNSIKIDWNERDNKYLGLVKGAIKSILDKPGRPIRVTREAIRLEIAGSKWFNSKRLVETQKYIMDSIEAIDSFRLRKIKWAIEEMKAKGLRITPYQVQLFAGFGGNSNEVKRLIEQEVINYNV